MTIRKVLGGLLNWDINQETCCVTIRYYAKVRAGSGVCSLQNSGQVGITKRDHEG